MLNIWTEKSGYTFGTIQEGAIINLPLPTNNNAPQFKVISGQLPTGLRIVNSNIVGTAFEVPRTTEFNFCIRATLSNQISDRTFKITVEGADVPVFNTNEGSLPVGTNSLYFVLDSSFVNFQISVTDTDTTAGQVLKYFISSGDGDLPPGLTLTEDGKIVGLIKPLFAI